MMDFGHSGGLAPANAIFHIDRLGKHAGAGHNKKTAAATEQLNISCRTRRMFICALMSTRPG
jgi:hypothetical protein